MFTATNSVFKLDTIRNDSEQSDDSLLDEAAPTPLLIRLSSDDSLRNGRNGNAEKNEALGTFKETVSRDTDYENERSRAREQNKKNSNSNLNALAIDDKSRLYSNNYSDNAHNKNSNSKVNKQFASDYKIKNKTQSLIDKDNSIKSSSDKPTSAAYEENNSLISFETTDNYSLNSKSKSDCNRNANKLKNSKRESTSEKEEKEKSIQFQFQLQDEQTTNTNPKAQLNYHNSNNILKLFTNKASSTLNKTLKSLSSANQSDALGSFALKNVTNHRKSTNEDHQSLSPLLHDIESAALQPKLSSSHLDSSLVLHDFNDTYRASYLLDSPTNVIDDTMIYDARMENVSTVNEASKRMTPAQAHPNFHSHNHGHGHSHGHENHAHEHDDLHNISAHLRSHHGHGHSHEHHSGDCENGRDDELRHCHSLAANPNEELMRNRSAWVKLCIVTVLCLFFMGCEIVGGVLANSLAIQTDAAHLAADIAGFGISIFSIYMARMKPTKRMSFGFYRTEVLGALFSTLLIWLLTGILVYFAVERIIKKEYDVDPKVMLITASCGVIFNIIMAVVLHSNITGLPVSHHGHSHDSGGHGHGHGHSHEHDSHEDEDEIEQQQQVAVNNSDTDYIIDKPQLPIADNYTISAANGQPRRRRDGTKAKAKHDSSNINIRAASIHVLGDFIQSVGVLIAATIIYFWVRFWRGFVF